AVVTHGGRQDGVIDQGPRGGRHNVTDRVVDGRTRQRAERPRESDAAFVRLGWQECGEGDVRRSGGRPDRGRVVRETGERVELVRLLDGSEVPVTAAVSINELTQGGGKRDGSCSGLSGTKAPE